jgi:toxin HigB-1
MEIEYQNTKIQKVCTQEKVGDKKLGKQRAELVRRRLTQLRASENLAAYAELPGAGRPHELKADRKGQFAIDLDHPYRLIFVPATPDQVRKPDGGFDWTKIVIIEIAEITDYHRT